MINKKDRSAYDAAESLIRGYTLQDIRMDHLRDGNYDEVEEVEEEALDEMAEAFEYEFPDSPDAAEAGMHFMRASFMQDEIENWEVLSGDPDAQEYVKVSDYDGEADFDDDPRWNEVENELRAVCDAVGIDEKYVEEKKKFLKLHEKGDPAYRKHAANAEEVKIRAMIDDENGDRARELSRYFLKGVQMHDDWDNDRDLDEDAIEFIGEYYEKIADLRS